MPNWSLDMHFGCSHFLCIFNICRLVGDRIQFYSLIIVVNSCKTLNRLQITTYRPEMSNAVAYIPENQFLNFPVVPFSGTHFCILCQYILHISLSLQYSVSVAY